MLTFIMVLIFLLGFPFEWIEICLIVLPIFGPILLKFDFSDHLGRSAPFGCRGLPGSSTDGGSRRRREQPAAGGVGAAQPCRQRRGRRCLLMSPSWAA
ncbi:MAG TPA: hypothetical protein VK362_00305 [Reyranella sp.]|nr:hypothetical protein [Reyranella sp.]